MIAGPWAATTVHRERDAAIDAPATLQLQHSGRPIRTLATARRITAYSAAAASSRGSARRAASLAFMPCR